jgi:hypothetical protein
MSAEGISSETNPEDIEVPESPKIQPTPFFSMDSSQPLFSGKAGEDVGTFIDLCEFRLLGRVSDDRKNEVLGMMIFSGLRETAAKFGLLSAAVTRLSTLKQAGRVLSEYTSDAYHLNTVLQK